MKDKKFGFLLVDKPVGWTSFDVCAKLRKQLKTKKIGHTGTLDPFATGLLVVAVGKATKLIPFFEKDEKVYETKILLGHMSETLDTESEIIKVNSGECVVGRADIVNVLKEKFTGEIQQIPPKYSALKIGGKKMCDMARRGEDFEIKPRDAKVIGIEVLSFDFPVVKIGLRVAAGFYVRSFARDLGTALGCGGGICQELRRIGVGYLCLNNDSTLSSRCIPGSSQLNFPIIQDITTATSEDLISPEKILNLPQVEIETGRVSDFLQGRAFPFEFQELESADSSCKSEEAKQRSRDRCCKAEESKFMVLSNGRFLGLGEMKCGNLQPRMGFN